MQKEAKKTIDVFKMAAIPGLLLGCMNGIGKYIKQDGGLRFSVSLVLFCIFCVFVATIITAGIFIVLDKSKRRTYKRVSDYIKTKQMYCVLMFCLIVLFLIPSYLSVYPGLFNYDAPGQLVSYLEGTMTEHHPVLHTYLLGKVFCMGYELLGDLDLALSFYFGFQVIVFTLLIVYIFSFLYEKNVPIIFHILLFGIITMYPPITLHLLCITKDNFFALFFVDFIIANYKFFDKDEDVYGIWDCAFWVVFLLGTIIYRNNAIYVIGIFAPLWFYGIVKKHKNIKKSLLMVGIVLAIFLLYKYPFTKMITVGGIDTREMMSVPLQQYARIYVYHYDELSEDERENIEALFSYIDLKKWYDPLIADGPKAFFDTDKFGSDPYKTLYVDLFKRYPTEFVDSFLENTYGFWYMWPRQALTYEHEMGYMIIRSFDLFSIKSKNPKLLEFYELFHDSKLVDGDEPWSFVFMPATYLCSCIIFMFYAFYSKDRVMFFSLLFTIVLWATFLLGPVALVRYVLFLYILLPVEFAMAYLSKREES